MCENTEKVIRHLEMIQGVINRMARNSFLLKGWAVTLVVATLWVIGRREIPAWSGGILIGVVVSAFGWLDYYYLRQERLFRELYNDVRKWKETDFSMATQKYGETVDKRRRFGIQLPNTLFWFYAPLLLAGVILALMGQQQERSDTCSNNAKHSSVSISETTRGDTIRW